MINRFMPFSDFSPLREFGSKRSTKLRAVISIKNIETAPLFGPFTFDLKTAKGIADKFCDDKRKAIESEIAYGK
jgi:hypothetical protein